MMKTIKKRLLPVVLAGAIAACVPFDAAFAETYDPYSEDVLVSSLDFDALSDGASTGDIMPFIKTKANYPNYVNDTISNTFSSSYYRMYHTGGNALVEWKSNAEAAEREGYLNSENGLFIENGRLKMAVSGSRTGANNNGSVLQLQLNRSIQTGCVRIRYDFSLEEMQGKGEYGDLLNFIGNDRYTLFQNGSNIQIKENQTPFDLITGAVAGVTYHTEILLNLDDNLATVSVSDDANNSGEKTIKVPDNSFSALQFWCRRVGSDLKKVVFIDNIAVSQPKMPEIERCNMADRAPDGSWENAIGVELNAPELCFNLPLLSTDKIKLYANGVEVEDPQITLSEDGRTATVLKPLTYSMPYSLVIDAQSMMAANKLYLPAQTISFHTMHKPFGATVTSASFTDANGAAVESLDGLNSITVQAELTQTESSAERATLIVVLYDAEGIMQQVVTENTALSAAAATTVEATMDLPEGEKTGFTVRAYFWSDLSGMQIIKPTVALGE